MPATAGTLRSWLSMDAVSIDLGKLFVIEFVISVSVDRLDHLIDLTYVQEEQ